MNIQELRMNSIIKLFKSKRLYDQTKMLGRWGITYCKPTMNKKIDLANEDHCGVCYSTKYHNPKYVNNMNTITTNTRNTNTNTRNANKHNSNTNTIINKNPIIDLE
jgi:hypothetical protein